jgi:tetratricopeptide (TPR) repeat protein
MSKVTFLPFHVSEGVPPALGRQLSSLLCEQFLGLEGVEAQYASYLATHGSNGGGYAEFVALPSELSPTEVIEEILRTTESDFLIDGLLTRAGDAYTLTVRVTTPSDVEGTTETYDFVKPGLFEALQSVYARLRTTIGAEQAEPSIRFGTNNPEAFLHFLEGYDTISYLQQAGPRARKDVDVGAAFDRFLAALNEDDSFAGAFDAGLRLGQLAIALRVGDSRVIEDRLKRLAAGYPNDPRLYFLLGELYIAENKLQEAEQALDKAASLAESAKGGAGAGTSEDEGRLDASFLAALHTRLGLVRQEMGMPAGSEIAFKKAAEYEGPEKPALDLLAPLLFSQNRQHELPGLWRQVIDQDPTEAAPWVKYAMVVRQLERPDDAKRALEDALGKVKEPAVVKRFLAAMEAESGNYDRAMDLYEDFLDEYPDVVPVLFEYAQTLQAAGRTHEIPDVLEKVLASDPDPNTRAHAAAWLFELKNPKRVEALKAAHEKVEKEDFQGAVEDLEKMVEWMDDYWKGWALLANLYNRLKRYVDAEKAAKRTLSIFPGCEPAYVDLANALVGQGKADQAYRLLAQLVAQGMRSLPIVLELGMVAKKLGRETEVKEIVKAIREAVGKDHPEIENALKQLEGP